MSEQRINFYGIEEVGLPDRRPWPGWTSGGRELGGRPTGRIFPSEYNRLLAKERREPWMVLWLLVLALCVGVAAFYLFG